MSVGKHPRRPLRSSGPIERGTPMKRGGPLTPRQTKMRTRNAKRARENWARAYGSAARVEWLRSLPSVASGLGPCEAAHVGKEGKGMSRKANADQMVPLTHHEHIEELHRHGPAWFEAKYGIDLEACRARIASEWAALGGAE